jgi:hypothetical protein
MFIIYQQLHFKMENTGFWLHLKPFAYFIFQLTFLLTFLRTIYISNDGSYPKKYELNTFRQISDKTEVISAVTVKHS